VNAEIKAEWLKDLRSGEFKQGRHFLKTLDGEHCCLGVLCEQAVRKGVIPPSIPGPSGHSFGTPDDMSVVSVLPDKVVDWAELSDVNPSAGSTRSLAGLNDSGLSFLEIANLIEEHL
jgi:hypothetical protein